MAVACGLLLRVCDWLCHLTFNTGELKKCERRPFTDWDWAQIDEADPLPGPVGMPSSNGRKIAVWPDFDSGTLERLVGALEKV